MSIYWQLFLSLAKISATCFGGGYAIIPLLQRELVEKKGWLTTEELTDLFSIAQCTPGVIAVNAASYVGMQVAGVGGAACATVGVLAPPLIIITLIAAFFWPYLSYPAAQHILAGLQACACALILMAVVQLMRSGVRDLKSYFFFFAAMLASLFTSLSPAIFILAAALCGLLLARPKGGGKTP